MFFSMLLCEKKRREKRRRGEEEKGRKGDYFLINNPEFHFKTDKLIKVKNLLFSSSSFLIRPVHLTCENLRQ